MSVCVCVCSCVGVCVPAAGEGETHTQREAPVFAPENREGLSGRASAGSPLLSVTTQHNTYTEEDGVSQKNHHSWSGNTYKCNQTLLFLII